MEKNDCFALDMNGEGVNEDEIDEEIYRELIACYNCPLSRRELWELIVILKRDIPLGPEIYYSNSSPNCLYGRIYLRRVQEKQSSSSPSALVADTLLGTKKKGSRSEKDFLYKVVNTGFDGFHYYKRLVIMLTKEKNYAAARDVAKKWFDSKFWMFDDHLDFYKRMKKLEHYSSRNILAQPEQEDKVMNAFRVKIHKNMIKDLDKELIRRSKNNEISLVRLLVENGANINAKDGNKHCALHYALDYGHFELCKLLLNLGANPNDTTSTFDRRDALLLAVDRGIEYVKLLVEHGADVHAYHDYEWNHAVWMTPLFKAIEEGRSDIAKYLLDCGVDINYGIRGAFGQLITSPLVQAITNNDLDLVEYLVRKGADVNCVVQTFLSHETAIENIHMEAPILAAIRTGNIKMVELLIHSGVNLKMRFSGVTRLNGHFCAFMQKQTAQEFSTQLLTELRSKASNKISEYDEIVKRLTLT